MPLSWRCNYSGLQIVRDHFNSPIRVTSTLRTATGNALVDGASNSRHLPASAIDFQFISNNDGILQQFYEDFKCKGHFTEIKVKWNQRDGRLQDVHSYRYAIVQSKVFGMKAQVSMVMFAWPIRTWPKSPNQAWVQANARLRVRPLQSRPIANTDLQVSFPLDLVTIREKMESKPRRGLENVAPYRRRSLFLGGAFWFFRRKKGVHLPKH